MKKIMFNSLVSLAMLSAASVAPAAGKVDAVNKESRGARLSGYDPLTYFKMQQPTTGIAEFSATSG